MDNYKENIDVKETVKDRTREEDALELLNSKALPDSNFSVEHISTYGLNSEQLKTLIDPKNIHVLDALGGIDVLLQCLNTDKEQGIRQEQLTEPEVEQRVTHYGTNVLPASKQRGLFKIILLTLDDKVLIVLIIAALISLALGLYETFGQPTEYSASGQKLPKLDWLEGVAILAAVLVVTLVGSICDWNKERQFARLNSQQGAKYVDVIRGGSKININTVELMAGDVMIVKSGDIVAADGVLVECTGIECDESSVTGESDTLKKYSADIALQNLRNNEPEKKCDCFLISGSEIQQGSGKLLLTSVGVNSVWGATFASLQQGTEITPLQEKLNMIADGVARAGTWSALILFIVLFIRFLVQISGDNRLSSFDGSHKASQFMDIFIVSVTVVVVAVPEGLPLAVTVALGFATTKMVQDNCLVRVLKSCETMGGATSVCSDKTGTLTQNKMTVVRSVLGNKSWELDLSTDANDNNDQDANEDDEKLPAGDSQMVRQYAGTEFEDLIKNLIVINSSVEENEQDPTNLSGSKTEIALINYARGYFGVPVGDLDKIRQSAQIVHTLPFHSARKFMATVVQIGEQRFRIFYKGAAEILTNKAHNYLSNPVGEISEITRETQDGFNDIINGFADNALRCIAVAYKDVEAEVPPSWEDSSEEWLRGEGLTFVGLFGIQDPLRPGVREAVETCRNAGVTVRMLTGDNLRTAKAISKNAGILTGDSDESIALEGPEFRKIDNPTLRGMAPKIKVIARCSPQDKRRFVEFLRLNGETVAVTGDGTNDAPALRLADVGFAMGIAGTEIAKEAADFIILDDNFATIVNAIKWGRSVNDTVRKYIQFQLTVNVCAVILTFITAVASSENEPALTAIQLLWVNMIMDTIASLAFATDPPSNDILKRKPDNRKDGLISPTMWKMILGQTFFQLCVTLVLNFAGHAIFFHSVDHLDEYQERQIGAMVFNTFVWLQIFNIFGSRRLDNKINILKGLHKNFYFLGLVCIIIGFQFLIIFVGGATFNVKPITGAMWGTSVIAGLCSIPMGLLLKYIPDKYFMMIYPRRLWHLILKSTEAAEKGVAFIFKPVTFCFKGIKRVIFKKKAAPSDSESVADSVAISDDDNEKANRIGFVDLTNHALPSDEETAEETYIQRIRGGRAKQLRFLRRKKRSQMRRLSRKASSFFSNRTRMSSFSFGRTDTK